MYEGPVAPYCRPPFKVGSMAGEWSYRARGLSYPFLDVEPQGPDISLSSRFVLIPLLLSLFIWSQVPCFVPKRRSPRGVIGLRVRATLALLPRILPFIGYMSRGQYVTSPGLVTLFYPFSRVAGPL